MPLLPFQKKILAWYRRFGRDLPWRHTHDPYKILVAEIMLQQTQVSRVIEIYPEWIKKFPDFASLAKSTKRNVLIAWAGMGYNRRALFLHQTAQIIIGRYENNFPVSLAEMNKLPGVGNYTSTAILCFSFQQRVPVVDINIKRLLSRMFWKMPDVKQLQQDAKVQARADALLPQRSYYDWNQALMDFGSLICTAIHPHCVQCPVQKYCQSFITISKNSAVRTNSKAQRTIPRRIYRGRVIQQLRQVQKKNKITFQSIGKSLDANFNPSQHLWLNDVLRSLEKDALIQCYHGKMKVVRSEKRKEYSHLTFSLIE